MKVLIIDNDEETVTEVKKVCRKIGYTLIPLQPNSHVCEKLQMQLKKLCSKESFDFALLDYKLWDDITGEDLIPILKEAGIPFVAFSNSFESNSQLVNLGAISILHKNLLYGDHCLDPAQLNDYFTSLKK